MSATTRERRRDYYLRQYGIEPDHVQDLGTGRYLAILTAEIDGEGPAAELCDSTVEACEWMAQVGFYNDNPRQPALVVDLDSGVKYIPETHIRVTLKEERR